MKLGARIMPPETLAAPVRDDPESEAATRAQARLREAVIRDGLRTPRTVRRFRDPEDEVQGEAPTFSLGWAPSLLLNLVLLTAPFALVIGLPPVLACRERAAQFGFFAGETLTGCAARGVHARIGRLDDRIKMLVRGSGG